MIFGRPEGHRRGRIGWRDGLGLGRSQHALKPKGAKALHQPFTPERILDALARAR
jgi:hypothetical protein